MIRCGDGSLYTGITTDVERRLAEHLDEDGKAVGAKYLRGKRPLSLVYSVGVADRSKASKLEYRVKRLSKTGKENMVNSAPTFTELCAMLNFDE